jgi:hypothetical protein
MLTLSSKPDSPISIKSNYYPEFFFAGYVITAKMASSSLGHPYADKPIEEIIPQFLQQPKLTSASLVQARRKARYVPQGSGIIDQNGPNQINFILSDSSAFLDPNSACLSGFYKSVDATGADIGSLLCDGLWSLFLRLRVYCGGVLVEDINQIGIKNNMEVYTSMTQEHYNTQASALAMCHKYNPLYTKADGSAARKNAPADRRVTALRVQKAGVQFSLPLSYISGFFRNEKAYPLFASGQLQMTLDLQRPESAFVRVGATVVSPTWSITGLTMETDVLTLHPLYTEAMASLCRAPGMGYRLPITTHNVQQVSIPQGAGTKSIAVPQAVSNLRQVSWVIQPTADLADITKDKATFPLNTYVEAFAQVGSHRFPENPAVGVARAYAQTVDADNGLANINSAPIIDVENFCGYTVANAYDADCAAFVWSVSLDRVKDVYMPLDGISGSALGGQIVLTINNTLASAGTLTVVSETTKFISLTEGRIEVA